MQGRLTRIGTIADRVIEAGWLLVVVMIPYFFNLMTARHFEPDKATALRAIVLVMLAAAAVKMLERVTVLGQPLGWQNWRRSPLAIPVAAYAGIFLLATMVSVEPGLSWWGGYNRLQGTYTNLSYVALFALIVANLRTHEQLDRLITAMILTAMGVALYGLIQHGGIDPLPWKGDTEHRVASTMGNSIFVAAYLIMVVPFVLYRLFSSLARVRSARGATSGADWLWLAGFALVLVAQQALLVGQLKFGASVRIPDFRFWWVFPGALALLTGSFALASLRQSERRTRALPAVVGGGIVLWLLLLLLQYAASAGLAAPAQTAQDTAAGSWSWWTLFGVFGLASFAALHAFGPRRPAGARIWEVVQVGVYGAALLVICLAIFFTQSRGPEIGLIGGLVVFANLLIVRRWRAGQAVDGTRARRWGLAFAGISVLEIATLLFLLLFNFSHAPLFDRLRQVPYVGRLGELTETKDGTGRVRVLIWKGDTHGSGAIGLITSNPLRALIGYGPETMFTVYNPFYPPELARYEARGASPDRSHQELLDEIVTKGILGLLSYFFLFLSGLYLGWRLLWRSISVPFQLLYSACFATLVAHLLEGVTGIPIVSTLMMLWVTLAVVIVGGRLDGLLGQPEERLPEASPVLPATRNAVPAGGKRQRDSAATRRGAAPASGRGTVGASRGAAFRWVYGLVTAAALFGVWSWNLKVVYADMYYNLSQSAGQPSDVQTSLSRYALTLEAVRLAPAEDYYYLHLGNALIQLGYNFKFRQARTEADIAPPRPNQKLDDLMRIASPQDAAIDLYQHNSGPQILEYARIVLEEAYRLSPTNKDHSANLGRLFSLWYQIAPDPGRLQKAIEWYSKAQRIAPNDVVILDEYATTEALGGPSMLADAEQKLKHAEQLDPSYVETYLRLGNLYRSSRRWQDAGKTFAKALGRSPDALNSGEPNLDRIVSDLAVDPAALQPMADVLRDKIGQQLPAAELARLPAERQQTLRGSYARMDAALGRVAAGLNDSATVKSSFDRGIALAPDNVQVRQQYTVALSDTRQYDNALNQAQTALQMAQQQKRDDVTTQLKRMITVLEQRRAGGG
ncbi:MAG: O-antigen ligase family protein [Herpetosiphon sp.]